MAFQAKLSSGTVLKISNRDDQTHLSLHSEGETQGNTISSGQWKHDPAVFETADGAVLRIEGDKTHYTSIKDGSMQSLNSEPELQDAKELPLEKISDDEAKGPHMRPMAPMQPMKPMPPMD